MRQEDRVAQQSRCPFIAIFKRLNIGNARHGNTGFFKRMLERIDEAAKLFKAFANLKDIVQRFIPSANNADRPFSKPPSYAEIFHDQIMNFFDFSRRQSQEIFWMPPRIFQCGFMF